MTDDHSTDRPDEPQPKRRRRRPPVLELEATEVGGKGRTDKSNRESKRRSPFGNWETARASIAAASQSVMAIGLAAAVFGAIAGGAIVYFGLYSGRDPTDTSVRQELAALSKRIDTLRVGASDPSPLAERIDRLTAAINQVERRLIAVEGRPMPPAPDTKPFESRTASIEAGLKDLQAAIAELRRRAEQTGDPAAQAVQALVGRIGELEARITSLAATDQQRAQSSLAREISALRKLEGAIASGGPFAEELSQARAALGERGRPLADLAPASNGLPTKAALAARFANLAPTLARGARSDGDYLSKLLANASRLVEVRPIGEPKGSAVDAVVARMETRLAQGDLAGALVESEALPGWAKEVAADWLAAAHRRLEAEKLVGSLMNSILAAAEPEKASQ